MMKEDEQLTNRGVGQAPGLSHTFLLVLFIAYLLYVCRLLYTASHFINPRRAWSVFPYVCVCVCVFVGLLRRKGGKMGERRELPKTQYDQRLGDFCQPHYTRQLSGQKYTYSYMCICLSLFSHYWQRGSL